MHGREALEVLNEWDSNGFADILWLPRFIVEELYLLDLGIDIVKNVCTLGKHIQCKDLNLL